MTEHSLHFYATYVTLTFIYIYTGLDCQDRKIPEGDWHLEKSVNS